jgi:hypothetical protein
MHRESSQFDEYPLDLATRSAKHISRSACQRCHKNKERCQFDHGQQACNSCRRLKLTCKTRPKKRMGRKPVVANSPYGNYSIISLETTICPRDKRPASVRLSRYLSAVGLHTLPDTQVTVAKTPSMLCGDSRFPSQPDAHILGCYPHREHVAKILANKADFFAANRRFITGSSFSEDFRACALVVFARSSQILVDAYHALLELMSERQSQRTNLEGLDLTVGLQSLREFTELSKFVASAGDAAVVIMLGQILLAYNAIMPLGSSTHTITRSTLWSTKDWYPVMIQEPRWDAIIFAPIFVDTIDCLIRRIVPVIRLPTTERCIVDRLCGVCTSLLPLLYDLCQRSSEARTTATSTGLVDQTDPSTCDPYKQIEEQITAWSPTLPPDFYANFTAREVDVMSAQAQSYQTAILLVIHRLRHPLGVEDAIGHRYATAILEQLSPLRTWPSDGATGLALDFPLLMAMVELPLEAGDLFRAFEPLRYRRRQSEDMVDFIETVNRARQSGFVGLWFELVQDGFRGDFLP